MVVQPIGSNTGKKPKQRGAIWPVFLLGAIFASICAGIGSFQLPPQQILPSVWAMSPNGPYLYAAIMAGTVAAIIWLFLFFGVVRTRNVQSGVVLLLCVIIPASALSWLGSQDHVHRASERAAVDAALAKHHEGDEKLWNEFGSDMTHLSLLDIYNRVRIIRTGTTRFEFSQQTPFTARDVPIYRMRLPQGHEILTTYAAKFAALDAALAASFSKLGVSQGDQAKLQAAMTNTAQADRWARFWGLQHQEVDQLGGLLDLYAKGQANSAQFQADQAAIYDVQKQTASLLDQFADERDKMEQRVRDAEPAR